MTATILGVDDEANARRNIDDYLSPKGYEVITVATMEEARACLHQGSADIILLDVQLPDGYGPDLLEETALMPIRSPIILITAHGDIDMAVDAMKNGAHDFISKPIEFNRLETSIERANELVAMRRELNHLRETQRQQLNFVIGNSPIMQTLVVQAQRAAQASVSVLITGETGTGKDVLARAIHQMGPRAKKPYVAVNCAAIQSTVLESELFGHEAGAFTSAQKRKPGLMEVADQGVLFLDEISSMPVDMQAKLLRVLDDHKIRRVGGTSDFKVDVQIIAASNRDLDQMRKDGTFRDDLYYRLKVVDLHVPPLRDRKEDIPELVGSFIREFNISMGKNITDISPNAMEILTAYNWPGNIRVLRNIIERAMIFCDDATIEIHHLPVELTLLNKSE